MNACKRSLAVAQRGGSASGLLPSPAAPLNWTRGSSPYPGVGLPCEATLTHQVPCGHQRWFTRLAFASFSSEKPCCTSETSGRAWAWPAEQKQAKDQVDGRGHRGGGEALLRRQDNVSILVPDPCLWAFPWAPPHSRVCPRSPSVPCARPSLSCAPGAPACPGRPPSLCAPGASPQPPHPPVLCSPSPFCAPQGPSVSWARPPFPCAPGPLGAPCCPAVGTAGWRGAAP